MCFSPDGRYLTLWTRPLLLDRESGVWLENVLVYDVESQAVLTKWSNKQQGGWQPQFTQDGSVMAKNFNNREIHFYELSAALDIRKPSYKFRLQDSGATFQNFRLSPGLNPSVAVFIPEKGGKPAEVLIYNIPNFNQPVCSKLFFKAEKCQLQWNALGTALLALASTDHDSSNKSYYGETNLYLLGIAGSYERIDLKREGPIHDITWSPSAREFAVSYGYMPSETTFFDARGNLIFSLPTSPRNTILYSPHGRYVLVAGFGNLQGTVDVYDRQNKFAKVCTFEASNTSVCEWSPCGRYILTATTSPRLRVDNGLKVWYADGTLLYYREYPELFSIAWKPQPISKFPALKLLEPCPPAHQSATEYLAKKAALSGTSTVKKVGAYRPPHARNSGASTALTSLYQKELQSNLGPKPAGAYVPGRRVVPGAQPVEPKESKSAAKNKKKREGKNADEASPTPELPAVAQAQDQGSVVGGVVSMEEKKIRALLKKLRAIEALKMRQAGGEQLEETQINKINKEDEIRQELGFLGWSE
ncbi:eIF2A-domain-containing protein [Metschnikowia bicuspidata var. bicuspidata NRRL YB-4993]|uniref:Eukaryotic translation initiation factor 2A n=1 Tax=Metschnikowia bicuspidata var. bicuspidata NRRL YB-4993 TaxID=869754 RepID=A0A1A0H8Y0_9ASCO|nr:eIF2A-domain-containing protein [Metschnikowia bicuspidata var. bicuspidata NRRL YB-4993]OBA20338.1 eIF2A-domain-containing protein [Metschnikowia bicuspidata var. bicuspidata NRRL YB-4993]